MGERMQLPLEEIKLAFAASCVEGAARKLGVPYIEVYERMKKVELIDNYILKHYDTLHTESREYLIEDVIECLNNWEKKAVWKYWLDFIVGNRQGKNPAKDYDYVEGGIANDRVIDTVNLYIAGFYDTESALQQLAFHKPNNQICILNQELLNKYLEYDGTKEI